MALSDALALALAYAERGLPVFPTAISWDEGKGATNKRPLTEHGFNDASTDPREVRRMFLTREVARRAPLDVTTPELEERLAALAGELARERGVPEAEALAIVDALERVHDAHLIHKDINPSNIVWKPAGPESPQDVVKLIDFGIASELSHETAVLAPASSFHAPLTAER